MNRKVFYAAGAVAALSLFWFLFFREPSDAATGKFNITFATAEPGDVSRIVSASGSVRALTTVEVGSQVSGQIIELLADYNTEVTEGQIIARIDPQTFESRVESAKADVLSARAALSVQEANIASAEATLAQAEKTYARQKALFEADAVAQSTLEDNERALAVARASLEVSRAQLKNANASLSQRLATLRSAEVDLERTIIRSPIKGVVISRNVNVGQTVAASFSAPVLFTIAEDLEDIRIDAAVVEADIGGINAGDAATFRVDAYPDQTFTGTVEQVRLVAETLQNVVTYTVVIAAENRNGRLLPGMTANVEITADKREGVLRIEDAALRFRPPEKGPAVVEGTETNGEAAGAGGGPQNGRGGAGGGQGMQMLESLNLPADRKAKIQAELEKEMRAAREAMGDMAQFDRAAMRQRMQSTFDKVMRENLTAEEQAKLKAAMAERPTTTRVEAYIQRPDGQLEKTPLLIGLQDGAYAEVIRGADAGDKFVTRIQATDAAN